MSALLHAIERNTITPTLKTLRKCGGLTLIEVLIAGSVLTAVLTGFLAITSRQQSSQSQLRENNTALVMTDAFRGDFIRRVQALLKVPANCTNPSAAFTASFNGVLPSGLAFSLISPAYIAANLPASSLGPREKAAVGRCKASQTWMVAPISTATQIYFCVKFSPTALLASDQGLKSMSGLLGEFLYTRWDLAQAAGMCCKTLSGRAPCNPSVLLSDPSMGLLSYSLYWNVVNPNSSRTEQSYSGSIALSDF